MTLNVLRAPYDENGSLLRVGRPGADWREPRPFWATLTIWNMVQDRYLLVRDMAAGATYPINWGEWWPVAQGQGLRLATFDPIAVVVTRSKVSQLRTTCTPGEPPDDWPLACTVPSDPGGWAQWATTWTGCWRVRQVGRAYSLIMDPTVREEQL